MEKILIDILKYFTTTCIILFLVGGIIFYVYLMKETPRVDDIANYEFATPLEIYSHDGKLIKKFGIEKRELLDIKDTPEKLIQAILAIEDTTFYQHRGIDYKALLAAGVAFLTSGEYKRGGSTITMQVARNLYLTRSKTIIRKLEELVIAMKLEQKLNKNDILKLYLNKIFLGHNTYGFKSAAKLYYNKDLKDLNLAQIAMLAGLPQAPSTANPLANPKRAKLRRNRVLTRMFELEFINYEKYQAATNTPISADKYSDIWELQANFVAEEVRLTLLNEPKYLGLITKIDAKSLHSKGYKVYTYINSANQRIAYQSVINGLFNYENRKRIYKPEQHFDNYKDLTVFEKIDFVKDKLNLISLSLTSSVLLPAIIDKVDKKEILVRVADGSVNKIRVANIRRIPFVKKKSKNKMHNFLKIGDLVRLRKSKTRKGKDIFELGSFPQLESALISLDAKTGKILAMVGGVDFENSKFNRALKSKRQIGSTFKPFIYYKLLEKNKTLASIVYDIPPPSTSTSNQIWRVSNSGGSFLGPIRLRQALAKSRNLATINEIKGLGIFEILQFATKLGFDTNDWPRDADNLGLGSGTSSPLQLALAFNTFANDGYLLEPKLIHKVIDSDNLVLFEDKLIQYCKSCQVPKNKAKEKKVLDESLGFLINSALRSVVEEGTARKALRIKRDDIYGKTGTTNDANDSWFSGYSYNNITTTVWAGYDKDTRLGAGEAGSSISLPIWINYMKEALKNREVIDLVQPDNVVVKKVDKKTGQIVINPENHNYSNELLQEYFIDGIFTEQIQAKPKQFVNPSNTTNSSLPQKEQIDEAMTFF